MGSGLLKKRLSVIKLCPIHSKPHPIRECRAFRDMSIEDRRKLLKRLNVCFRCCASSNHIARHCKTDVRCEECSSNSQVTALHYSSSKPSTSNLQTASDDGGEVITNKCSEVCRQEGTPRSCSKICLVRAYLKDNPSNAIKTYVLLDDQSNGSLARSTIFTKLAFQGDVNAYTIKTVTGEKVVFGRKLNGLVIESLDGKVKMIAPSLLECQTIPGNLAEVPTPEVAESFQHLKHIASKLPPLEESAEISILLGRDAPKAHKVRESRNGPDNMPWAQCLDLGWVVIGEVCVNGVHKKNGISTCRTEILPKGRPSKLFEVCRNHVEIQDSELFKITPDDEKTAMSTEDRKFVEIMNSKMQKDKNWNWEAPLPFKEGRKILPNNKPEAHKRLQSLIHSFKRRPQMKQNYFEFMGKIMERGHAEAVNDSKDEGQLECWYLPHVGIYHPKKPEKIRVVFDSSAESKGVSLNDVLLSGPDLVNSLHGVLVRFRKDIVPIMADVEQMFYSFKVSENHRDFLRFLWYRNNDPAEEIVTYRMKVHIFGNKPSPAVATFGLRRTAEQGESKFGEDARSFVDANFYVDDGLKSVVSPGQAIDLLRRTQAMLATANIRLHKIVSSNKEVLEAFDQDDIVPDLREWDPDNNAALQRSLGVYWNVTTDSFTFRVSDTIDFPNTKRKVLSEINSVFDPLQFAAPVTIEGKALLREMTQGGDIGWDDPLPQDILSRWNKWRESLSSLSNLSVARPYTLMPAIGATRRELHVFSDASNKAVGAVCYLKTSYEEGKIYLSFVAGKAKLAHKAATSVPRLELCGAVLAVDLAAAVLDELSLAVHETYYYTDSKVVLGYIRSEGRRFYTYVANRVARILQFTTAKQWNYVRTDLNPADEATRSVRASDLHRSRWLMGPAFLRQLTSGASDSVQDESIELENDPEVRREVTCNKLAISETILKSGRFNRFSSWKGMVRAIANLTHVVRSCKQIKEDKCQGWHICEKPKTPTEMQAAERLIIKSVQNELFHDQIIHLRTGTGRLPANNCLIKLNPYLDEEGIVRVGGRLANADIIDKHMHPIILPKNNHVTDKIIEYCHQLCRHQGRHFTLGSVRNEGYWVIGGRRYISKIVLQCVICKKLRGKFGTQVMAGLPKEQLTAAPPFTFVGVDVFGPWLVQTRCTRGGQAHGKRWAVIFTCMVVRGVHIEVLDSMDSSCLINALRRFFAIRGPAKKIRSDCGSNFVGACNEIGNSFLLRRSTVSSDIFWDTDVNGFLTHRTRHTWVARGRE